MEARPGTRPRSPQVTTRNRAHCIVLPEEVWRLLQERAPTLKMSASAQIRFILRRWYWNEQRRRATLPDQGLEREVDMAELLK